MSTVLWTYYMVGPEIVCDESDKWALHKHAKKLDGLLQKKGLPAFTDFLDTTDLQYNMSDEELPPGVSSTRELMAQRGNWKPASDAHVALTALLDVIASEKIRFGLIGNDHDAVVSELKESLEFVKQAKDKGAQVNFSVIM